MFYKISTLAQKSLTYRKNKTVSLKSLNLYSSDSEKNNDDKKKILPIKHLKNEKK